MAKWVAALLFTMWAMACSKNTQISESELGFRYHIPVTPQTFDPILQKGTSSWFLLNHLYRPLISLDENDTPYFNAAKDCVWSKNHVYTCTLKSDLKFQDGSPIYAEHFKHSFELIHEQSTEASGLFLKLKNQNPHNDIEVLNTHTLKFTFKTYAPQDVLLLAKTEFSPRPQKKFYKTPQEVIASGPYKVFSYKKNQHIILTTNTINDHLAQPASSQRPNVTVYFIEDEGTAVRMYETQKLDFIKNIPRAFFDKYKSQLHFQTMMRMDGLGFSDKITNLDFKKALSYSLNFSELQTIYKSKGVPGCPALPSKLYSKELLQDSKSFQDEFCYVYDLDKALKHYAQVPEDLKNKTWTLSFSELGGADIKKGMEWVAHQWKKNLNLNVVITPLESGQFFQRIRDRQFDVIRKGIPLLTPSCAEALDNFTTLSVNNFIGLKDPVLDQIVNDLKGQDLKERALQQELCARGLKSLKSAYSFIPLGEMYFAFLSNDRFKNWSINSFNMLNLENLEKAQ